jgi:integrase
MVRKFAKYLNAFDARTEIPPQRIFPYESKRRIPYLYQDEDVLRLIETARKIDSQKGLDGSTYSTIFGLLAVTGMRVSEALNLECKDVDLHENVLTLRQTKGNKSRLVPLHHSTGQALRQYARLRDRIAPQLSGATFFVSEQGMRLTRSMVRCRFDPIASLLGLRGSMVSRNARIHDLRHRFAISTLQKWYKSRINVDQRLPELATYLGHVHVRDTYWYLSATPELLKLATARLQRRKGGRLP